MTPNYDALRSDALYYDYSSAANPIRQGLMPPVPYHAFSGRFFEEGQTRIGRSISAPRLAARVRLPARRSAPISSASSKAAS